MKLRDLLVASYPEELVDLLIDYFREIDRNYRLEKWKPSELDSGHFVEVARRVIENQLFGSYTPVGSSLGSFNSGILTRYESGSGDESYRIIIPRVLYAVYCVRNKRGVGHVGAISPNMILDPKMKAADKVLLTLYKEDGVSAETLRERVNYKNQTNFKKILKQLESKKLIHCTHLGICKLSPLGLREVEGRLM